MNLDSGTIIDGNAGTAISFDETGEFTYKVNRDGSFTQEGTFTSNPVGDYVITGVKWVGQIGAQGSILILSGPFRQSHIYLRPEEFLQCASAF